LSTGIQHRLNRFFRKLAMSLQGYITMHTSILMRCKQLAGEEAASSP